MLHSLQELQLKAVLNCKHKQESRPEEGRSVRKRVRLFADDALVYVWTPVTLLPPLKPLILCFNCQNASLCEEAAASVLHTVWWADVSNVTHAEADVLLSPQPCSNSRVKCTNTKATRQGGSTSMWTAADRPNHSWSTATWQVGPHPIITQCSVWTTRFCTFNSLPLIQTSQLFIALELLEQAFSSLICSWTSSALTEGNVTKMKRDVQAGPAVHHGISVTQLGQVFVSSVFAALSFWSQQKTPCGFLLREPRWCWTTENFCVVGTWAKIWRHAC